jgi:CRP-like cAMP-binding protein
MEAFFAATRHFLELSRESKSALSSVAKRRELPAGSTLIKANSVCNHFYFIEEGLTRTFYIRDGKDITDWFSTENSIACSIVSFISRKEDIREIELLEPSVVWAFEYSLMETLYIKHHEIERLGRLWISQGLIQLQQRFDDLHFATASERYEKLIDQQPSLLQRVPLGMIASYLGITQETLSRIRSKK